MACHLSRTTDSVGFTDRTSSTCTEIQSWKSLILSQMKKTKLSLRLQGEQLEGLEGPEVTLPHPPSVSPCSPAGFSVGEIVSNEAQGLLFSLINDLENSLEGKKIPRREVWWGLVWK